ncbi:retropepsin-like aspartic protease family protein [Amorphus coralli]|uniref:retropepsin-like aspartic protease family protein n=1 Tax=Amorphus coralli TaxID=340680 RepID=UPI0003751F20|nr:TIGR02281 family clan AA aspartic protease [Amorphus coralli]
MRRLAIVVVALVVGGSVVLWLVGGTPTTTEDLVAGLDATWPRALALVLLLAVIGAGVAASGPRVGEIGRALLLWGGLAAILVAGYSYRHQIERVGRTSLSAVVPGMAVTTDQGVTVTRSADGHFRVQGAVNGAPVTFLLDTGASTVLLTSEDASRAGIAPTRADFTLPVSTANGLTRVAPVSLDLVTVGSVEETHVDGAVAAPGSVATSLLGMSFLSRLYRFEVSGDRLTMQK